MKFKICRKCEKKKSHSKFYDNKANVDGKHSRCKECCKDYFLKNKQKISARRKVIRDGLTEAQKEKYRTYHREYSKKKYANDPVFALIQKSRARVRQAFKSAGLKKNHKTFDLIGCSPTFLRDHIKSLWTEGMNWNNHSRFGWVIDHIIPLDSFDLTDPVQLKKAFHWTNQQPLWCGPNRAKWGKILNPDEMQQHRKARTFEDLTSAKPPDTIHT